MKSYNYQLFNNSIEFLYPESCDQEAYHSGFSDLRNIFKEDFNYQARPLYFIPVNIIYNLLNICQSNLITITIRGIRMSGEKTTNLQEVFLNSVRKDHVAVTVFLVNGVKLQGIITWFDNFSLLLKRDQHIQLVYKHAISTIMPVQPINLEDTD